MDDEVEIESTIIGVTEAGEVQLALGNITVRADESTQLETKHDDADWATFAAYVQAELAAGNQVWVEATRALAVGGAASLPFVAEEIEIKDKYDIHELETIPGAESILEASGAPGSVAQLRVLGATFDIHDTTEICWMTRGIVEVAELGRVQLEDGTGAIIGPDTQVRIADGPVFIDVRDCYPDELDSRLGSMDEVVAAVAAGQIVRASCQGPEAEGTDVHASRCKFRLE